MRINYEEWCRKNEPTKDFLVSVTYNTEGDKTFRFEKYNEIPTIYYGVGVGDTGEEQNQKSI